MPADCGVASKIMSSLRMNDSLFTTDPGDVIPTAAADCENYCEVRFNLVGAVDTLPEKQATAIAAPPWVIIYPRTVPGREYRPQIRSELQ